MTERTAAEQELWAAQINADEAGNLLYEAEQHIRDLMEILEDTRLRHLLGRFIDAQKHIKHADACPSCREMRFKYQRMRQQGVEP